MTLPLFLSNSLLFLILIGISLKDFRTGIIPDILLGGLAVLGILRFGGAHFLSVLILGGLSYGLYKVYPYLRGKEGLGLGDVKMLAVVGIWLSAFQIPLFLMLGGGIGVLIALFWRVTKKGLQFPLGPALALALGICIVGDSGLSKGENKMTTSFSGPHLSPTSGSKPDSLVVLIHGYGSDGEDLISLGKAWSSILPNTLFVAPHGPIACEVNPSGNQWFGLRDWDSVRIIKEIQSLTPSFNRYLDGLLKTYELPPEKLALVGFSQGAMLALHVALHRPRCAGVIAYSGAFVEDPHELKVARPPVLLIHGTEDQVLLPSFSQTAETRLKALSVPVTLSLLSGLEHGIDGRGLGMGGAFLKDHLYENTAGSLLERAKESNN